MSFWCLKFSNNNNSTWRFTVLKPNLFVRFFFFFWYQKDISILTDLFSRRYNALYPNFNFVSILKKKSSKVEYFSAKLQKLLPWWQQQKYKKHLSVYNMYLGYITLANKCDPVQSFFTREWGNQDSKSYYIFAQSAQKSAKKKVLHLTQSCIKRRHKNFSLFFAWECLPFFNKGS